MKLIAIALGATALFWTDSSIRAQNSAPPTSGISPALILNKYLAATGGLEARQKLNTITASGQFGFSLDRPIGSYSFYYKAPFDDMLEVQPLSHGTTWTGHHAGEIVRRNTPDGVGMINGAGMWIVEEDCVSLFETDFDQRYRQIELIGRAEVGKRWAFALRFTPKVGDPQVRYYDSDSFLLVRLDQLQRFKISKSDRESVYKVESYFTDYHEIDGITLPRQINVSRDMGDLIFRIANIKTGADIPNSVFIKPKAGK